MKMYKMKMIKINCSPGLLKIRNQGLFAIAILEVANKGYLSAKSLGSGYPGNDMYKFATESNLI